MINLFVIAGQYSIVMYIVWLYWRLKTEDYVQNIDLKILVNNEDLIDQQKLGFGH